MCWTNWLGSDGEEQESVGVKAALAMLRFYKSNPNKNSTLHFLNRVLFSCVRVFHGSLVMAFTGENRGDIAGVT